MFGGGIIKNLTHTAHEFWIPLGHPIQNLLPLLREWVKLFAQPDLPAPGTLKAAYFLAPLLGFMSLFCILAILPWGREMCAVHTTGGVLLFIAAEAGFSLFAFLAAWARQTPESLWEGLNLLKRMISFEIPLLVSIVPVIMISGTLDLSGIVQSQAGYWGILLPHWHLLSPWGFFAFLLFISAGTATIPLNPLGIDEIPWKNHSHSPSGATLAIKILSHHLNLFIFSAMGVTLFLGGYQAPFVFLGWVPSPVWFVLKTLLLFLCLRWIHFSLPRLTSEQVISFCWKILLPLALSNLLVTLLWHYAGDGGGLGCILCRWIVCPLLGISVYYGWVSYLSKSARFATRSYPHVRR